VLTIPAAPWPWHASCTDVAALPPARAAPTIVPPEPPVNITRPVVLGLASEGRVRSRELGPPRRTARGLCSVIFAWREGCALTLDGGRSTVKRRGDADRLHGANEAITRQPRTVDTTLSR
jgi:hypothetical protein